MLSWTLQGVKERLIAALSVVRWPQRRVLKQRSSLPIRGAKLKFIKSSKSKILGLFSVFQAFFVALKDTLPQTADPWCMSIRWSVFFLPMLQEFLPEALALLRLCMTSGKFPLPPTGGGASELMLCHFCLSPHLIFSSVPVKCRCSPPGSLNSALQHLLRSEGREI